MRTAVVVFLASLLSMNVKAQQIRGLIQDDQGKPLAGASISLKKSKDSSVVKLAVSDSTGNYELSAIPAGAYFIGTSHIGYASGNSPVFETKEEGLTRIPAIVLPHASADLREVMVTSHKPPVEVKADKIILNVEGSTNAVGQDALELLRKSPGVTVDKDNNLSLSGKNGVQIYIDGKPTPLSGNDLSEYLKTIQSSSIESIEIISNPGAKYEAAGNAGIINIKLKKNRSLGTNGSVNAGYNIGTYSKYNAGLSLNHRDKDINIFGNYSYNHNPVEYLSALHREQLDTLFDQHSTIRNTINSHNFKAGLDYFINKKNTLGLMVNGTYSDNSFKTNSSTPISYIPTGQLDRLLVANNRSSGRRDNTNLNVNYRYADTSGHELTVDADYGAYRITNNQLQPNVYYDPAGKPLDSITYNMLSPSNIKIYSGKLDYEQNFWKGRLGFGFKASYVTSGNNFEQYDITGSNRIFDSAHSNNFDYKENINAVYGNYSRSGKGWTIQAGLRIENTNTKGISTGYALDNNGYVGYDSGFDRHYVDFFPSGAITYNKNPMKQWSLNYSRRIDRPAYQDLNPFEFKLDEYTFQKGNTLLKPQYTNSIGLTYTYKSRLTATLNYSHVKDVFTQLLDTVDKSKAFLTKQNLATQNITSLNISYPFQYQWYSLFANVNTFYSIYNANFGTGRTVNVNVFATNIYTQQTAKLGHGWTGEVSGFYNSPSIWQGTFKTNSLWSVDGGLSKTLLKGNATLKASVSDIFNTLRWSGSSNFAGQYILIKGSFESRQFKLYFTYRFGNTQVKAARQHKTGAEDENKRVN
ncbi:MAG TPA: outer membrane beta-barrel family protein [Puia sp.]|nr:outer membrane beta-barrel family protein [Puia sp.]